MTDITKDNQLIQVKLPNENQITSTIGPYRVTKTLGEGRYAKTKLAYTEDGTRYALKIFNFEEKSGKKFDKIIEMAKEEFLLTRKLQHKHIVKHHDFHEYGIQIKSCGSKRPVAYIVQEAIMGGDLINKITKTGGLSEDLCRQYFKQLLKALHYMHSNGIAHRDLKPDNIMLDENNDIKIIDFGFASSIENRKSVNHKQRIGTAAYMPPEMLEGQKYRLQDADLFALGVVLFTMRTGNFPFDVASKSDNFYKTLYNNKP